ncbi:alpha/beta fold hydrolase [Ferruginibacter sp.]
MEHLLLLHGAIGTKDQLSPLADALKDRYTVHTISFCGHGGAPFAEEPFSMELFANDVLQYLQRNKIEQVNIFGYSMGGYVALYLAKHHPHLINKVITLATKFYWDENIAAKEIKMLDAATIEEKIPAFAAQLQQRHGLQNWKPLLEKTAALLTSLGKNNVLNAEDYSTINNPALVLLGDRDKMITLEETIAVYTALPNARMGMLPNTAHPIEKVHVELLSFLITQFLGG